MGLTDTKTGLPAVRLMADVAMFPALSVACTVMRFGPIRRGTSHAKLGIEGDATAPLQATLTTPDKASVAVPVMVALAMFRIVPSCGEVITRIGGVLSRLTVAMAVAVFPATSEAVPLID